MPSLEPGEKCVQAKTARIHKGRSPSWIGDDPQPHSGDLSVVGPWIVNDSQPRSGDLSVGTWIVDDSQPHSGDLSVVGPWIGDDSQPRSGDLSVVEPWIEDDPQPRSVDLFVGLNGQNHQIQRREDSQMARFEPAYPSFETPLRCE